MRVILLRKLAPAAALAATLFTITLAVPTGALAWSDPPPPPPPAYLDDGHEAPANLYLADSPWPMTHRGPYNQASSPWAGLDENDSIDVDYIFGTPGAITMAYGNPNGSGKRSFWTNTPFYAAKIDPRGEELDYLTAAELAAELGICERARFDFFDALVATDFLEREGVGARYANTP